MDLASPEYLELNGKVYHLKQLTYPRLQDIFCVGNVKCLLQNKHKLIKLANDYYKVAKIVRTQKHTCPVGKNCVKGKTTKHRSSADSYYGMYNTFRSKLHQLVVEIEFEIKCKMEDR